MTLKSEIVLKKLDELTLPDLTSLGEGPIYYDKLKERYVDDLVRSIEAFKGLMSPLVINDKGLVICGRQRYKALKKLNWQEPIPCYVEETPPELKDYPYESITIEDKDAGTNPPLS